MLDSSVHSGDRIRFFSTAALVVAALLLGGGQGGLGDTFVQILGLTTLTTLLVAWARHPRRQVTLRTPAWLALVVLAIPLLQLVPIPLEAWQAMGGRAALATQLASVGVSPMPHLALQPLAAERALWGLVPAVAIYISVLALSVRRQRQLMGIFLVMAFFGLVLGLVQLADGQDSAFRLYANTNRADAVGFFANRNHLAAMLVMALPLSLAAVASAIGERTDGKPAGPLLITAAIGCSVILILGIALTRSRSGLLLGMLGLFLSVPLVLSLRRRRGVKRAFGVIVTLALLLTVQFALFGILQRLEADPLGDQRWQIASITIEAAKQNAPLGSGLGSFRQVFQTLDTQAPGHAIVNHAHDDYLELWLEAGWGFVALGCLFIGVWSWASIAAWRSEDGVSSLWAKAASLSLLLVMLHSVVDYPLRTTSIQAVFALLLAVLMSWRWPNPSPVANPESDVPVQSRLLNSRRVAQPTRPGSDPVPAPFRADPSQPPTEVPSA